MTGPTVPAPAPSPLPSPTQPNADPELVVLAYSGGLDTTVIVHRLTHEHGRRVVALLADVGQGGEDLTALAARALKVGATDAVVVDARERFAREFLTPAIAANALYEGRYPLVSALSRPLIAQLLVEEARRRGAGALAHGCTGKGNDQVRFEVSCGALAPDLEVLAPVRDWAMTRPEAIEYADKHGIDLGWISLDKPWSVDQNLWGRTIEAGVLEDPWVAPPEDAFTWTTSPTRAEGVTEVAVSFEAGVPVATGSNSASDSVRGLTAVLGELNRVGGAAGFGRVDMIENRRVGIKSREVYEVPGALATIAAHREVEDLTLDRDVLHEKARVELRYAELVYDGLWFSPLRSALDAFIAETQKTVTGEVRLQFSPGRCQVTGRRAAHPLYRPDLATYAEGDTFDHDAGRGFVALWGLPARTWAKVQQEAVS